MTSRFAWAGIMAVLSLALLGIVLNNADAHEGAGAGWLLSYHVRGDLSLQPDESLSQWREARAVNISSLDGAPMTIRSVNNGTHVVFLISRPLSSIDKSGVILAFEGAGVNGSDDTWSIIDGKQETRIDPGVVTQSNLKMGRFTATFVRPLETGSFVLKIGSQYDSFVKATSWNNGTRIGAVDLDSLKHWNFEVLPAIDEYPKLPVWISAALVGTTVLFVAYETRRYSH